MLLSQVAIYYLYDCGVIICIEHAQQHLPSLMPSHHKVVQGAPHPLLPRQPLLQHWLCFPLGLC